MAVYRETPPVSMETGTAGLPGIRFYTGKTGFFPKYGDPPRKAVARKKFGRGCGNPLDKKTENR
jgi:hypothetical protein